MSSDNKEQLLTDSSEITPMEMAVSPPKKLKTHEGYDPEKSTTTTDALRAFLQVALSGDIKQVPGIGEVNAMVLSTTHCVDPCVQCPGITTSYELLGKFLLCKTQGNM